MTEIIDNKIGQTVHSISFQMANYTFVNNN